MFFVGTLQSLDEKSVSNSFAFFFFFFTKFSHGYLRVVFLCVRRLALCVNETRYTGTEDK